VPVAAGQRAELVEELWWPADLEVGAERPQVDRERLRRLGANDFKPVRMNGDKGS
jgi:hypothetical protein